MVEKWGWTSDCWLQSTYRRQCVAAWSLVTGSILQQAIAEANNNDIGAVKKDSETLQCTVVNQSRDGPMIIDPQCCSIFHCNVCFLLSNRVGTPKTVPFFRVSSGAHDRMKRARHAKIFASAFLSNWRSWLKCILYRESLLTRHGAWPSNDKRPTDSYANMRLNAPIYLLLLLKYLTPELWLKAEETWTWTNRNNNWLKKSF